VLKKELKGGCGHVTRMEGASIGGSIHLKYGEGSEVAKVLGGIPLLIIRGFR